MTQPSLVAPASLADIAARLRYGAVDVTTYVDAVCDRIEQVEPHILALVPEDDRRARLQREAHALRERYADPTTRPALFGVLVGIKDIIRVDGFETRAGTRLPSALFGGPQAACVTRLRQQGALVLGKTVTAELAYIAPGVTRNPHNPGHTPGGSSSGSAAGVSAGFYPLALGTQTVGSVLRPAAYCGIVGFKPSFGRIPTDGVLPVSASLDTLGLFTSDAVSSGLAASVLLDDWNWGRMHSDHRPVLGVPEGPYLDQADDEALDHFEAHVAALERAGYAVKRVPLLADIADVADAHITIMAAEMADVHRDRFEAYESLYRPQTASLIRQGQRATPDAVQRGRNGQRVLRSQIARTMTEAGVDLWVTPTATGPAPETLESTGNSAMSLPWTYTGMPALTLPAGRAANGLPLGVQLVGRCNDDELLLAWAKAAEAVLANVE